MPQYVHPRPSDYRPTGTVVREMWIERRLPGGFVAAFRMVDQDGTPVVAEVRVFPHHPKGPKQGRRAGTWSEDEQAVPSGGVTSRAMKAATLTSAREGFTEAMQWFAQQAGRELSDQALSRHGFNAKAYETPQHPGFAGKPDEAYLDVAIRYARCVERGSRRPARDVAAEYASERHPWIARWEQVRDLAHEARERGLLTYPPRRGMPGGVLTDKAREMLGGTAKSRRASPSKSKSDTGR